ncbi:MAG: ABC transporter substrate-binding protein [Gammaproteobacteria bacterium]|nr:ABC transporter substrate-binding protein [Gammaproteobacteria bacterium]
MSKVRALLGALLMFIAAFVMSAQVREDPLEVVRSTADQVLERVVSQRAELEAAPRKVYELVNQIVLPRFDFTYMSRLVLGRYWQRASTTQQQEFTTEFRELLVRTYATALLNYSGQEIVYLPLRMNADETTVKVNTRVQASGAPPIPIDYSLYLSSSGRWLVYDVAIDNISLVSQYRNSYATQIKRFKMDGLIDNMKKLNRKDG